MGLSETIILALGVAAVAAVATGLEWLPRYLKRRMVNDKLGVRHEPELRGELVKAFVTIWLCRVVQVGLVGAVIVTHPVGIGWVPIGLGFILSLVMYFPADRTRRNLLA